MPIFLLTPDTESKDLQQLEDKIRSELPNIVRISSIEELLADKAIISRSKAGEKIFIIFPVADQSSLNVERLIQVSSHYRDILFFILVSDEISATNYKRLVRTGGAEWTSTKSAPIEIPEIIARGSRLQPGAVHLEKSKAFVLCFIASAGGVGNTTVAMETAIQLTKSKSARRVCLVDLDFQTSHVCDYLDIEPRLQIHDLSDKPERLDSQLIDLSKSSHSSGLDVFSTPRQRGNLDIPNLLVMETFFEMISDQYDIMILVLPAIWFPWTGHVVSASDRLVVTGINTIPGLRNVSETLEAVRGVDQVPERIAVTLNRCKSGLLGGVEKGSHAAKVLRGETIFYLRDDAEAAFDSVNTGIPASLGRPMSKLAKDIAAIEKFVSEGNFSR